MGFSIRLNQEPLQPLGGDPVGTRALIRWLIDHDVRFSSSSVGLRAAMRIEAALDGSKGAETLYLEQNADYELLKAGAETPQPVNRNVPPYPWQPARKMLPFVEDIVSAKEGKPKASK